MRKVLTTVIVAFAIMLGGITVMAISFGALGGSFESLETIDSGELKIDTVTEPVASLLMDLGGANVEIVPSEDGQITVSRHESEKIFYSVSVEEGTLTVRRTDTRKWYERIFPFRFTSPNLTVRLPAGEYEELTAKVRSYRLFVAEGIVFSRASVTATSGAVQYCANVKETLNLTVTSGGVVLKNVTAGEITGSVTSGRTEMENIVCNRMTLSGTSGASKLENVTVSENFSLEKTSGSVTLEDVVCAGDFFVKCTSGAMNLDDCDGKNMTLESTSGSIRGTLRSPKIFDVRVTSGSVRVPESVADAGMCKIRASSGSVKISIEE